MEAHGDKEWLQTLKLKSTETAKITEIQVGPTVMPRFLDSVGSAPEAL